MGFDHISEVVGATPEEMDRLTDQAMALASSVARGEVVETYEDRKAAPFKAYEGAVFTGAKLDADDDLSEPSDLILSFEGLPDLRVSAWGAYGYEAGFDIEPVESTDSTV